jgi:AbrB family looped-hinge helix DNA binding protein
MVGVAKFINLRERLEIRRKSMVKKGKNGCLAPGGKNTGCCKVESLISIDERGQMVLPKELRDKAKIQPGDKLAVISWEREGKICCMALIKAEYLAERVKDFLGPVMKNMFTS